MISSVLTRESAALHMVAMFYKAVASMVLLYRVEIWIVNHSMEKHLERFHWHVFRKITKKQLCLDKKTIDWVISNFGNTCEEAKMYIIIECISRYHKALIKYAESPLHMTKLREEHMEAFYKTMHNSLFLVHR